MTLAWHDFSVATLACYRPAESQEEQDSMIFSSKASRSPSSLHLSCLLVTFQEALPSLGEIPCREITPFKFRLKGYINAPLKPNSLAIKEAVFQAVPYKCLEVRVLHLRISIGYNYELLSQIRPQHPWIITGQDDGHPAT